MGSMGIALVELLFYTLLGLILHEGGHLVFGFLFGGDPSFSDYFFKIPRQTDFENPQALNNIQVRILGGFVYVFPIIALYGAFNHSLSLMALGVGGSGISWTDLLACWHPDKWKDFTDYEPLHRSQF